MSRLVAFLLLALSCFFSHACKTDSADELCHPNPCVGLHQTVCLIVDETAKCYCDPGYVMDEKNGCILSVDDPCDPNPCSEQNKTRCHAEDGLAVCSCDHGYEMDQEEKCVPVTPCEPNPCKEPHKTVCSEDGSRAICSCDDGYLLHDEKCVRPCDMPEVCPEPGRSVCVNDGTSAACHCSEGFLEIGTDCAHDPCLPNPCHGEHKNTCIRQDGEFVCVCDPGFEYVDGVCSTLNGQPCSKDGWCRQNPLPTGEDLWSVWAYDTQNIFWVGNSGVILHFDGQKLTLLESGVGVDLYGIWGVSLGDIWACGEDGILIHYDGRKWTQYVLPDDIPRQNIRYIWGYGPQAVYACGDDGLLLFYDGNNWTQIATNLSTDTNLHSIWGTGPFNVYIASDFGKLLHWDGEKLEVEVIADGAGLFHVRGTADDDIWVATMNGTLFHYDGEQWNLTDEFPLTVLSSSFLDSDGVLWITGYEFMIGRGVLMRKVSGNWEAVDGEPSVFYTHVTGDRQGRVFASGGLGLAMEYRDGQLKRLTHGTRRLLQGIRARNDSLYSCGSKGRLVSFIDGNWEIVPNEISDSFHSICFNTVGNAVFAASNGHVYEYDGESFVMNDVGKDAHLYSIACLDDGNIMVAGLDGTCALGSKDEWELLETQTDLKINSIWFNTPVEGWAVGENGLLMAYDGSGWSSVELPHPVGKTLNAVFSSGPDSVFAVGLDGKILFWDGETWQTQSSSINEDLYGVWATALDDVWVVGASGTILHNVGDGWYTESSGTRNTLWEIWGNGAGEIWVVGEGGTILHLNR